MSFLPVPSKLYSGLLVCLNLRKSLNSRFLIEGWFSTVTFTIVFENVPRLITPCCYVLQSTRTVLMDSGT